MELQQNQIIPHRLNTLRIRGTSLQNASNARADYYGKLRDLFLSVVALALCCEFCYILRQEVAYMKLTRKEFTFKTVAAAAVVSTSAIAGKGNAMKEITLEKLPYAENALSPIISANTISFHYGKHHAGYVKTLNTLILGTKYEGMSLEGIVKVSALDANAPVFNNAAQSWNHAFYWETLSPEGKNTTPSTELLNAINAAFGSFGACKDALTDAAVKRFGSGWAWLVLKDGKLSVISTPNAETPITSASVTPLAVVDVWEHAYYLDWQNRRADHVKAVIGSLFDWRRISERFARG